MMARGLGWIGLAWATLPLAGCLVVLAIRRLGQVRPLLVATSRMVAQLALLAVVFKGIIAASSPGLVLAVATFMLGAAAFTVGSRQRAGHRRIIRFEAFGAMAAGSMVVMAVTVRLALRLEPWYEAQTVLPLLGMILGNTTSAVALAAERFESDLKVDRDLVELRLALGATSRRSALPALRSAVSASLSPIVNQMALAGLVAIPGMTTGQLLAGADVAEAIRYQILIYVGISATVTIAVLILLGIRLRSSFTPSHQLRRDVGAD